MFMQLQKKINKISSTNFDEDCIAVNIPAVNYH